MSKFDFEMTDEERKALAEPAEKTEEPSDEEFEDQNGDEAPAKADKKADTEEAADGAKAAETKGEEADKEEDTAADPLAEFMAKHKGKSPEELLKLAFNQDKARRERDAEAKSAKQAKEQAAQRLAQIAKAMADEQQARERQRLAEKRQFEEELKSDPDAATKRLMERQHARERQEEQQRQWDGFVQTQTQLFAERIHNEIGKSLEEIGPDLMRYAVEEGGYTPQEVAAAADHRDLLTLDRARRFSAAVKAGYLLPNGQPNPKAFSGQQGGSYPAQRGQESLARASKMADQAPRTLSDARGQQADGRKTLVKKAEEILSMRGDDFAKAMDSGDVMRLLREMDGE
jgi:hypothetical protein